MGDTFGLSARQQRKAHLKIWIQECGMTEAEAFAAVLRYSTDELRRGLARVEEACAAANTACQRLSAALGNLDQIEDHESAGGDAAWLHSLGIAG